LDVDLERNIRAVVQNVRKTNAGVRDTHNTRSPWKRKSPALWLAKCWVLATSYSRTACRRTTIGAAAFHFRVRNGNGWCHCAIVTRGRNRTGISLSCSDASARPNLRRQVRRLGSIAATNFRKNNQQLAAADPLTSTYRSSFRLRQPTLQPSFVLF
jgi:hypothetical protein